MSQFDNLATLMDDVDTAGAGGYSELPIAAIRRDPKQPRQTFDEASLIELAESIKAQGVVQPVVVRKDPEAEEGYLLVSGERRWRAAKLAELDTVPAVVRELSDDAVLAVQLVENLNREDVPVLEEAEAVERLTSMFGKAKAAGQALGKKPAWISQRRKVHKLPDNIKALARDGQTRDVDTLVMLGDLLKEDAAACERLLASPAGITRAVVRNALDVAKGRAEAAEVSHAKLDAEPSVPDIPAETPAEKVSHAKLSPAEPAGEGGDLAALEADLAALLGMPVHISNPKQGFVRIDYASVEQLTAALDVLRRGAKRP